MENIKLSENNSSKKQPSKLEAEQALLGSILVNNDIIDERSSIKDMKKLKSIYLKIIKNFFDKS